MDVWNETRILYWNKYDRIDIILENLRDYTVKHFTDEEQYMESINYKKIFTQKVQHLKFIHKLDEFIEHHNDEIEDQDEQIMVICVESAERLWENLCKLDSSMIMKGEKLTNQAFHPCFIYNSYCQACQEQAAGRLS